MDEANHRGTQRIGGELFRQSSGDSIFSKQRNQEITIQAMKTLKQSLICILGLLWLLPLTTQAKDIDPEIKKRIAQGSKQLRAILAQNAQNDLQGLSHKNRYVFGDTQWIATKDGTLENTAVTAINKLLVAYNTNQEKKYTYNAVKLYLYIGGTRGFKVRKPDPHETLAQMMARIKSENDKGRQEYEAYKAALKDEAAVMQGIVREAPQAFKQATYNVMAGVAVYIGGYTGTINSNECFVLGIHDFILNKKLKNTNQEIRGYLRNKMYSHVRDLIHLPRDIKPSEVKAHRAKVIKSMVTALTQEMGNYHPTKNPARFDFNAEIPEANYISTETYTAENCIFLKEKTNKKTKKAAKGLTVIDYTGTMGGKNLDIVWKPDLYEAREKSTQLKVIITRESTKQTHTTDFKRLLRKEGEFNATNGEMVIWVHFNAQNKIEERYWYHLDIQHEIDKEAFRRRLNQAQGAFLRTTGEILAGGTATLVAIPVVLAKGPTTAVEAGLVAGYFYVMKKFVDESVKLLANAPIPKYWWNPACKLNPKGKDCNDCKKGYQNLYKLSKKNQLNLAFFAGVYNGLLDQVKGAAELNKLAMDYLTDAQTRKKVNELIQKIKVSQLLEEVKKYIRKYTDCGEHYQVYQSGKDFINILSMFTGVGEVNAAAKSGNLLETLSRRVGSSATTLAKNTQKLLAKLYYLPKDAVKLVTKTAGKSYDLLATNGKKVIATLEDGRIKVKVWVDISGGKGKFLSKNLDESNAGGIYLGQTKRIEENRVLVQKEQVGICDSKGLCFAPHTLVFTGKQYHPIHKITAEDTVMAGCPESCVQALKMVEEIFVRTAYRITKLRFAQETILATPLHPFFDLQNREVLAGNLQVGDTLQTYNGFAIVQTTQTIDTTLTVYNFHVKDFHTYYVGKTRLWVHNMASHSLLDKTGKFKDNTLETDYLAYVTRKNNAGKTARDRLDWKDARDYWLYDSPMARGNDFNRKAVSNRWYAFNEVNLANGKRLDSYDNIKGEIVSRKATDLDDISLQTFETYLQEMHSKYAAGTVIRSNKYPILDGESLQGKLILELPNSNLQIPYYQNYVNLAQNKFGIELRFRSE